MGRIETGWSQCFIVLMFLLAGCNDSNSVYQKSIDLPDSGWDRENTLEDSWQVTEPIDHAAVVLSITFSPDFGYQNLYLTGDVKLSDDAVFTDTFSVQLASPRVGRWLGHKNGELLVVNDTLPFRISLEIGDHFNYQISQYSREEVLQGIHTVELKVLNNF